MRNAESWDPIVQALGYDNEKAMLEDFYEAQGMSIGELAERIGYSRGIIIHHLIAAGIKLRGRGGPNRKVTSKLAGIKDEEFVDIQALASKLDMHHSTVYKEARRRGLCISVLSLQRQSLIDTPPEEATNSVSPNTATAPMPRVELTLSGIEEELLREISSSSTTAPTKPPDGTPNNTSNSPGSSDPTS
jgi:DNA-binding transcriptional ArsR family regulator